MEIAGVTHAFIYLCVYVCVFVCQVRANCHFVPAAQTSVTALLTQRAAGHHQLFTKGGALDLKGQPGKCHKGQKINDKCAHYNEGRPARRKM